MSGNERAGSERSVDEGGGSERSGQSVTAAAAAVGVGEGAVVKGG